MRVKDGVCEERYEQSVYMNSAIILMILPRTERAWRNTFAIVRKGNRSIVN